MQEQFIRTDAKGTKRYYKDEKLTILHREDGPAVEHAAGHKVWWVNGFLHRTDGPAIVYANGDKEWWVNGKLHRKDGPALEYVNGKRKWSLNDKLHRVDGPAIVYANGDKEWWVNGIQLTEKQFNEKFKKPVSVEEKFRRLAKWSGWVLRDSIWDRKPIQFWEPKDNERYPPDYFKSLDAVAILEEQLPDELYSKYAWTVLSEGKIECKEFFSAKASVRAEAIGQVLGLW